MEVLVFSRTTGYRHDSIPAGIEALTALGHGSGFRVTATEDPAAFAGLARYAAVVFLNTSGDVLDPAGRAAFGDYLDRGGAFLGVHCAAHTETGWPRFADLIGARFTGHPDLARATVLVEDHDHPATAHLGPVWTRVDEWYDFDASPRGRVRVLLSVDTSSYPGAGMTGDHPIAWCRDSGGRSFYTALGHTVESYLDPDVRAHLLGGLSWVTGRSS